MDIELVAFYTNHRKKHPKCKGHYDQFHGDYECGYHTTITCEECKYMGLGGRKDPEAKCNQS